MWSNFFRLALEYSVQTGTPLIIRTEDVDCPLPTNAGWADVDENMAAPPVPKDLSIMTESTFGLVMCRLATLAATTQQAICSPNSRISPTSCQGLRMEFQQILTTIPACLRYGMPNVDSITQLQQNLIAMLVHRSSLLLSTHLMLIRCAPETYYKTLLFDIWDSSCSILHSIQTISKGQDCWRIGHQLSWADAPGSLLCGNGATKASQSGYPFRYIAKLTPHHRATAENIKRVPVLHDRSVASKSAFRALGSQSIFVLELVDQRFLPGYEDGTDCRF